jgi:16S rRNA (cytosine1402-N4)-methyltransferase
MMEYKDIHIPVLGREVVNYLNLKPGDTVFEGTLGGAGHTVEIIKAIAPTGKVIGVELDSQAISTATINLKANGLLDSVLIVNDNFSNVTEILKKLSIGKINGFLLDLGLSSMQIEMSERGFSYLKNEELDMRFNLDETIKASDIINEYSEEELKDIFFKYGEERWSGRIAGNIVKQRSIAPIEQTGELVDIIKRSIPAKFRFSRKGDPSKRIFQALRIEINGELDNLKKGLEDGAEALESGARMAIISYHSLEDRIVKKSFEKLSGKCTCPRGFPECRCGATAKARIITKKAITASEDEILKNPRSKSAKMRVLEKV